MDDLNCARTCADALYAADAASRRLGIGIEVPAAGRATATMPVSAWMLNGHGLCHGGYIFTLADTAFAFACNAYDDITVAAAASIEFLRPAAAGDELTAVAREIERRGRSGIYDVEVRNQAGQRVALFRGRAFATGRPLLGTGPGQHDTE